MQMCVVIVHKIIQENLYEYSFFFSFTCNNQMILGTHRAAIRPRTLVFSHDL